MKANAIPYFFYSLTLHAAALYIVVALSILEVGFHVKPADINLVDIRWGGEVFRPQRKGVGGKEVLSAKKDRERAKKSFKKSAPRVAEKKTEKIAEKRGHPREEAPKRPVQVAQKTTPPPILRKVPQEAPQNRVRPEVKVEKSQPEPVKTAEPKKKAEPEKVKEAEKAVKAEKPAEKPVEKLIEKSAETATAAATLVKAETEESAISIPKKTPDAILSGVDSEKAVTVSKPVVTDEPSTGIKAVESGQAKSFEVLSGQSKAESGAYTRPWTDSFSEWLGEAGTGGGVSYGTGAMEGVPAQGAEGGKEEYASEAEGAGGEEDEYASNRQGMYFYSLLEACTIDTAPFDFSGGYLSGDKDEWLTISELLAVERGRVEPAKVLKDIKVEFSLKDEAGVLISVNLFKRAHPFSWSMGSGKASRVDITEDGSPPAGGHRVFSVTKADTGVYTVVVENRGDKDYEGKLLFLLYEGKAGEKKKEYEVKIPVREVLKFRFVFPEAVFWDDEEYFSGTIEDSGSVTKYSEKGLIWKEEKGF